MNLEIAQSSRSTKEPVTRLSESWWNDFLVQTKNMDDSALIRSSFSEEDKQYIRTKIAEALRKLFSNTSRRKSFAFFLEGKEIPDQIAKDYLYENRMEEGEDLELWAARIFHDRKFMVIVNHTEKYSEELSILVARYFQPLIENFGLPLNGIEIDIIVGDYGFTPLGIHRDGEGENLFHFHLGPNDKIMYNWDTEEYIKLPNGIQNCMDIDPMLPHGKKFTISPRDAYFMPWTKFHIGYSAGFSIALVISFYNPTKKLYLDRLFKVIEDICFDRNNKEIALPEQGLPATNRFGTLENVMKLRDELVSNPVSSVLATYNHLLVLRIASNSGLSSSPQLLENETDYREEDLDVFSGKEIVINDPFKIYFKSVRAGSLKIFARLFVFDTIDSQTITGVIDQLNAGATLNFGDLMAQLEDEEKEPVAILLAKLYNRRAIHVI